MEDLTKEDFDKETLELIEKTEMNNRMQKQMSTKPN